MAGEATCFLSQSVSADDLDLELLDDRLGFDGQGIDQRRGFRLILRIGVAATLACACGWVVLGVQRQHHLQISASPAGGVELDGVLQQAPSRSLLKPVERMHDGNVCDANEELFGGLCYKKCTLLTNGEATIRTSSWTCCKSHPCAIANQKGSIGHRLLCNGYDVNGEGGCPHKPGACLLDEEMHLGICYKKCSLLTSGTHPYRVAAATCCKFQGISCLDIRNDETSDSFDVGGGSGDHDPSTPARAHPPQQRLTESGDAPVITTTTTPAPSLFVSDAHFEPVENLHDGNVCDDQEEIHSGLCYKKCSLLTNGQAPIRTSSWTCCQSRPCGLWNQKVSTGSHVICNGFDVSADGSCPHKPGTCLVNEEMILGVCYEKCSLLTNGAFPYRLTAASCCKVHGLGCLNPRNVMTSDSFDKGGGQTTDDHSIAHLPDETLTEAKDIQSPDQHPQPLGSAIPLVRQSAEQSSPPASSRNSAQAEPSAQGGSRDGSVGSESILRPMRDAAAQGEKHMPLGSALRMPIKGVSHQKPGTSTQGVHKAESEAARQAREAREAQEAVAAMVAAMRK